MRSFPSQFFLDAVEVSDTFFVHTFQANTEPIRLQQMLPTFPYFQLSRFSTLIADLGLTSSSYLDTYIPISRQWEQHTISSVRIVETQQRLLYRLRRSLIDDLLSEDECVSFREEIQMQTSYDLRSTHISASSVNGSATTTSSPRSPTNKRRTPSIIITNQGMQSPSHISPLKRTAPPGDIQESGHNSKVHISNNYYVPNSGASAAAASDTTSPGAAGHSPSDTSSSVVADPQSNDQVYVYQPVFYGQATTTDASSSSDATTPLPQYLLTTTTAAPLIPYHPHPPLKRWPNDYTVSEISNGFHAMDVLISRCSGTTSNNTTTTTSNMTQRTAFERVFGSRYVKSTVCRHRTIWRKANQTLREQFEAMGADDDRACWGEFVRRVEGRPPGKNAAAALAAGPSPDHVMLQTTGNSTTLQHYQTPSTNGENVHDGQQDPTIMNSMQNQGSYYFSSSFVCTIDLTFLKKFRIVIPQ
jgi:hypothetical protein